MQTIFLALLTISENLYFSIMMYIFRGCIFVKLVSNLNESCAVFDNVTFSAYFRQLNIISQRFMSMFVNFDSFKTSNSF